MTFHLDDATVSSAVGLRNVPPAIRALDDFARPDYVDLFTITTSVAADRSAEEWARATLEKTPTGRAAPRLWRALGLRLGPAHSPDYVQGWKVAQHGADWIRIEATSWCMTAHGVVRVGEGQVSLALFVRYDRPIAAVIWAPVSILHRRAVPVMLRQALDARAWRGDDVASPRRPTDGKAGTRDHSPRRPRRPPRGRSPRGTADGSSPARG